MARKSHPGASAGVGMEGYSRYAVYWAPEPGPLADWAASWLGWDPAEGVELPHPDVDDLPLSVAKLTATPRKYGFHGTLKPPFHLADGADVSTLHEMLVALAGQLSPVSTPGLALHRLGGFVALTPESDTAPLAALAAQIVEALDGFRAPPTAAEIARRRPERLTPRQRAYLDRWGYPYVMEEFRFHLTLTGDLAPGVAQAVADRLAPLLHPLLSRPFDIRSICLFGQGADGRFRLLDRYPLTG